MSTPGPWHANLTTTRINVSSKTSSIAHLIHSDDTARADAALIAAAPALLAAVREARRIIALDRVVAAARALDATAEQRHEVDLVLSDYDDALEQIDAAINAAEGR